MIDQLTSIRLDLLLRATKKGRYGTLWYIFKSFKNNIYLYIATLHNLKIHKIDVKIAFVNGELNGEIYLEQRKGLIVLG